MGICVAFGCLETGAHKFPLDAKLRKKWEYALKRKNFRASQASRLCNKHFIETDYVSYSKIGFKLKRKILKKTAIPSIFLWNQTILEPSARAERLERRTARRCLMPEIEVNATGSLECASTADKNHIEIVQNKNLVPESCVEHMNVSAQTPTLESCVDHMNVSTQTPTLFRLLSKDDLLIDDESVHYYTGLETYEKFNLVLSTLCPMAHNLKYKNNQVFSIAIEDQFLIMLMKLRRNTTYFELAKFFGISKSAVSIIFVTWINFVYDMWSLIDIWPNRELVDYYMPIQFKKYHANTRIIIDSTEIPIQKHINPLSQQATFSSYKNKNTLKFLVGATPGGLFTYCSDGYGGSTSDRQMIERSDLLDKCDSGDSIMADRGFNVQDMFASKNISVNIPAFLKGKSQLSGVTVKHDRTLASQRVHIERLIGLSKTYLILKTELNSYYLPLASRIF